MKNRLLIFATIGSLLAACAPATTPAPTPDIDAIRTSAANTVVAEITLTAAVFTVTPLPPTETPTPEPPTATPTATAIVTDPTLIALGTPGALCDDMSFDLATVDVTIPDGTQMTPGQEFVKTWKIKNTGTCAWGDGYGLIYSYSEKMNGQPAPLGTVVEAGQEIDVSVNFKAPDKAGEYTSAWQMANAKGVTFGKAIFVKIIVQ